MTDRLHMIDRRVSDLARRLDALPPGRLDAQDRHEIAAYGQTLTTIRVMLTEADQLIAANPKAVPADVETLFDICSRTLDDIEPNLAAAEEAARPKGRLARLGMQHRSGAGRAPTMEG